MNLKQCSFLLLFSVLFSLSALGQDTEEDLFADFDEEEETQEVSAYTFKGFLDARFGPRIFSANENSYYTLGEVRGQFDLKYAKNGLELVSILSLLGDC